MGQNTEKSLVVYEESFIPYIMKWGMWTNLLGALLGFLPLVALMIFYGAAPEWAAMLAGFLTVASSEGVMWFMEPVSFFPVLGIPAFYMSFLSGNVSNLRIPAATSAQKAVSAEAGTPEADIAATLGIGASVIFNILVLLVGAVFGTTLISGLPASVNQSLDYLLPALFGALWIMLAKSRLLMGIIGLGLGTGLNLLCNNGILPFYLVTILSVFGTIAIAIALKKAGVKVLGKEE